MHNYNETVGKFNLLLVPLISLRVYLPPNYSKEKAVIN